MTIFDFLLKNTHFFRHVIGWKKNGRLYHLNLEEYIEQIEKHILLLQQLEVSKNSKVGIICSTRIEWHLFDMATLALGATGVPLYPNTSRSDLREIQKICHMDVIVIENGYQADLFDDLIFKTTKLLAIEEGAPKANKHIFQYHDLLTVIADQSPPKMEDLVKEIKGEDICNYLLTSGTTDTPKVNIIKHENLYYLLENIRHLIQGKLSPGSRSLTNLPLAHVLGRCDSLLHLILPTQTVFGESIESLISDLEVIKPAFLITVPRLISKMREKITLNINSKGPIVAHTFEIAMSISETYQNKLANGDSLAQWERLLYLNVQKGVLKRIRDQISPNLRFIVTGGAPLHSEDYDFFSALGVPVLQGYGLTESLGPVCLNFFGNVEKGTVGRPFRDVNIKLDVDGEILIRAPFLFSGYLDQKGEVLRDSFEDEGYFRTGDIGELLPSGNLKITDRKKDIIVTAYGKNVSPLKIENKMVSSPRINHFMALGEGKPFVSGLISIKKESFIDLIDSGEIDSSIDAQELSTNPQVIEILNTEVKRLNEELSDFEKVKKFRVIPLDITGEADFLTPSLKIKRDRIYNKYKPLIDSMYQNP